MHKKFINKYIVTFFFLLQEHETIEQVIHMNYISNYIILTKQTYFKNSYNVCSTSNELWHAETNIETN